MKDKFWQNCYIPQSTKRVWTKGASSRRINSARFLITFFFTGTSTMEMVRYGSRRECESFASLYAKKTFTETLQNPWRISITEF